MGTKVVPPAARAVTRSQGLHLRAEPVLRLKGDAECGTEQYRRHVYDGSVPESREGDQARALFPAFALVVAVVAAVTDPSSAADLLLAVPVVGAFAVWAYVPAAPMPAVVLAVLIPVVVAQRSGELEPLMFEVSLLGYVVGRWAPSRAEAVALGVLALTAPVAASLIQDPSELAVGIWLLGIALPLGDRPLRRAPEAADSPTPGHRARACRAGAAGRAASDRSRCPRLRGPRVGRRHASDHQRPPRAPP